MGKPEKILRQDIFIHRLLNAALSLRDSECECDDVPHTNYCEWFNSLRSLETLVSDHPQNVINMTRIYGLALRFTEEFERSK